MIVPSLDDGYRLTIQNTELLGRCLLSPEHSHNTHPINVRPTARESFLRYSSPSSYGVNAQSSLERTGCGSFGYSFQAVAAWSYVSFRHQYSRHTWTYHWILLSNYEDGAVGRRERHFRLSVVASSLCINVLCLGSHAWLPYPSTVRAS